MAGGNRNAGKASVMTFDCTDSYWPDASAEESLVYTWSLDKVGYYSDPDPYPDPDPNPDPDPDH